MRLLGVAPFLPIFLIFTACISISDVTNRLSGWRGESEEHLLSKWGDPDVKVDLPDGRVQYVFFRPGLPAVEDGDMKALASIPPADLPKSTCRYVFTVDEERVSGQVWDGPKNLCWDKMR